MNKINNNDFFEQLVKSKLADYNAEVPHLSWEQLESSLLAAQKTKVVRKKWIISSLSAVAAALIGVFFVFQNMNRELPIQVSEHQTPKNEPTINSNETLSIIEDAPKTTKESTQILIADNVSAKQYNVSKKHISTTNNEEKNATAITAFEKEDDQTTDKVQKDDKKETSSIASIDDAIKQQLIEDFINEGKRSLASSDETIRPKGKSKISLSLTGQSGLSGSQQTTSTTPITLRSSLSETYGMFALNKMGVNNEEVEIKPESEISHAQPISFGVLTSFALTQKLQIETGLIYTYLSSQSQSQSTDYNEREKIQFHYLGVPLNLNYTLLSINKLDMFVSAGGMIEKDISGRIKYNDEKKISSFNSGYLSNNSTRINQNNPQLSVSSGLGITYPLYEKTKIFGKIGARYYINANNEFRTYYSDEKWGLDLQLGIKFNFKNIKL